MPRVKTRPTRWKNSHFWSKHKRFSYSKSRKTHSGRIVNAIRRYARNPIRTRFYPKFLKAYKLGPRYFKKPYHYWLRDRPGNKRHRKYR